MRQIDFGKHQSENLRAWASNLRDTVWEAIEDNLEKRDKTQNYLISDNDLFIPFIDTYVSGIIIHPMESYFLDLGKRIFHEVVEQYEKDNSVKINKEHLFFALSMLSIRCGDEISAMTFWELAQKENEYTNSTSPTELNSSIDLLQSKFTTILAPIKLNYDENKLIKKLRPQFNFIDDFQTVLTSLSDLHKAHFLSCGLKQVHILQKLRTYSDLHIIKIFAQELVNSLCVLNESLLKDKGLPGTTIGALMNDIFSTYPLVGAHLGQSGNSTGIYSIGKANFYSKYDKFINHIENNITDEHKLKADILYALHQLRNEALHLIDDTRKYYNDVELFEKTIGLLFICVSVINKL